MKSSDTEWCLWTATKMEVHNDVGLNIEGCFFKSYQELDLFLLEEKLAGWDTNLCRM